MSRIFLSHSSDDNAEAIALKQWLVLQDPPLASDIFLDLDPHVGIRPGMKWKDALQQANTRCEAVICLLSDTWEHKTECQTEFRLAESLHKRIFCARLEAGTGVGITQDWQWVDLFGDGVTTDIEIVGRDEPVAFLTEGLQRLKEEIIGKRVGPESFVWPPVGQPKRAPYRGWEPLEQVDAAVFFGRDAQILRGLDELRAIRMAGRASLFVILGPSGAGKSSFLRAGLLPRLRRDDRNFLVLDIVRPARDVIGGDTGLAQSIFRTRERLGLKGPQLGEIKAACNGDSAKIRALLLEAQQTAAAALLTDDDATPPTVVLPLDQAEELFGADAGADDRRFLDLVAELAGDDDDEGLDLVVAVTIRTDHHESLQKAKQLGEMRSVVFGDLKPMPQREFREVITGPARRATEEGLRLDVEPALVDKLLDDCTEGGDTLPLLALTLARLYEDYGQDGDLRLDEYTQMGEMGKVVQTEVDKLLSRGPQRDAELAILKSAFVPWLATINSNDQPVRRVAQWDDLPANAHPLLNRFVERRLLVRSGATVEVALESLLRQWEQLAGWLADERENLKKADALERESNDWKANGRNDAWLLHGDRVGAAESLLALPGFADKLAGTRDFVAASRAHEDVVVEEARQHEEDKRRQSALRKRYRILGAVAAAVIIFLVAGVAVWQYSDAKAKFREAKALQLSAQAEQRLDGSMGGGDVLALQQALAARELGAPDAESILNVRRDLSRIVENPPSGDGPTAVRNVAVYADESNEHVRIALAADDSKVRVWDARSGKELAELKVGDHFPAWSVAFSPDGTQIATGNDRGTLQLWNIESGQVAAPTMAHDDAVLSIAFAPDGRHIATGSRDGSVRLWDVKTGTANLLKPGTPGAADVHRRVAFNSRGDRLVTVGQADSTNPNFVRMWDLRNGAEVPPPPPIAAEPTSVGFSPDGASLAVGMVDGSIQVLDGVSLNPVGGRFQAHDTAVNSVGFSGRDGGGMIVSGGADNTIRVWESGANHTEIGPPLVGHHGEVTSVEFSPDMTQIVSGSLDGSVRQWSVQDGLPVPTGQGKLRAVAFSSDNAFASAGADGTVKVWLPGVETPVVLPAAGGLVHSLAFGKDRSQLVAGGADGSVRLWNAETRQSVDLHYEPVPGKKNSVRSVAFSQAGLIAAGGGDGRIRIWRAGQPEPIDTVPSQNDLVILAVALSPDGTKVAASTTDFFDHNSIQLWDVASGRPIGEPMVDDERQIVYSVGFSPDGERIVSGNAKGTIRLWDVATQSPLAGMSGDQNAVYSVAYSSDGKWIAGGDAAGKVRLWHADKLDPPVVGALFEGSPNWIHSVVFSPNNQKVLSASDDGTMHFWPVPRDMKDVVCSMISRNMTQYEWNQWVSKDIGYVRLCPDLPDTDESRRDQVQ